MTSYTITYTFRFNGKNILGSITLDSENKDEAINELKKIMIVYNVRVLNVESE